MVQHLPRRYLSAFLPASFCPSLRTDTGLFPLNFSFPVWGVYLIPCSRAQLTSNTHAAQNKKRRQRGGHTHREHMKERMSVEIDMNGKWVREGRVGGKIQSDDTDVMKNKGK